MTEIGAYIFATVLQLPFQLFIASPWLIGAAIIAFLTRRWRGTAWRLWLLSLIIAIGVAPAYGFHLSMMPVYTLVISGIADPFIAAVSILLTWPIVVLVFLAARRVRAARVKSNA